MRADLQPVRRIRLGSAATWPCIEAALRPEVPGEHPRGVLRRVVCVWLRSSRWRPSGAVALRGVHLARVLGAKETAPTEAELDHPLQQFGGVGEVAWALGLSGAGQPLGRTLYATIARNTGVTARTFVLIALASPGTTTVAFCGSPRLLPATGDDRHRRGHGARQPHPAPGHRRHRPLRHHPLRPPLRTSRRFGGRICLSSGACHRGRWLKALSSYPVLFPVLAFVSITAAALGLAGRPAWLGKTALE